MSIYYCRACGHMKDDDHDPMSDREMCPSCQETHCVHCLNLVHNMDEAMEVGGRLWHNECFMEPEPMAEQAETFLEFPKETDNA